MKTHSYDSDYLACLTGGWNKLSFPIISRFVRDTLNAYLPRRILDFGSGAGAYAEVLSESGGEVSACDLSQDCVVACEGKYSSAFILNDPSDLPSEAFNLIFSTEVLEHIKDYRNTIRHFRRALRPDGVVLLTTTGYSTSVFTMLYQVKNSGIGAFEILREIFSWAAGYWSSEHRDAFVERWCFEPLGGHYHGFRKGELLKAFRNAGFTVTASGVFYAIEPLQMPFLYSHTLQGIADRKDWSRSKRVLATIIYIIARPLNRLLKSVRLFANNLYVIARKDGSEPSATGDASKPRA